MNTQLQDRPTTDTLPNIDVTRRHDRPADEISIDTAAPSLQPSRRWIAVLVTLVVAAIAVMAVWVVSGDSDGTPQPAPQPAFDSPGGTSLNTVPTNAAPAIERPAFDSPGGTSLNTVPADR